MSRIQIVTVYIPNDVVKEVTFPSKLSSTVKSFLSTKFCYLMFMFQLSHGPDGWANEFTAAREQHGSIDDQWVSEFSKLHVQDQDWADEFGRQVGEGILGENSADNWADAYDE